MRKPRHSMVLLTIVALVPASYASTQNFFTPDNNSVWKTRKSIVIVHNPESKGEGSGVIIVDREQEGWFAVLTAQHVTRDSAFAYVSLPILEETESSRNRSFVRDRFRYSPDTALKGRVLTEAGSSDLALIFLDVSGTGDRWRYLNEISIARNDQCSYEHPFYVIGDNSRVDPDTVFRASRGYRDSSDGCSDETVVFDDGSVLEDMRILDAITHPGFSGGPVVNRLGQLIGIHVGSDSPGYPETLRYSVGHARMREFLSNIAFNFQIPIFNGTADPVRYKVLFGRREEKEWAVGTKQWLWIGSGECQVHHRQFSVWDLSRRSLKPIAFHKEERKAGGEDRPIQWRVVSEARPRSERSRGLDFRLRMNVSFPEITPPAHCSDFEMLYRIVGKSGKEDFELEWK